MAGPRSTLGHWQGCSLTHTMLITMLFLSWPERHQKPTDEVGFQKSRWAHPEELKPFDDEREVLSQCPALPRSTLITFSCCKLANVGTPNPSNLLGLMAKWVGYQEIARNLFFKPFSGPWHLWSITNIEHDHIKVWNLATCRRIVT